MTVYLAKTENKICKSASGLVYNFFSRNVSKNPIPRPLLLPLQIIREVIFKPIFKLKHLYFKNFKMANPLHALSKGK